MEPNLDALDDLEKEIDRIKDEFYESSAKNIFFKKAQKFECASQVASKLPLEQLLRKTCIYLPNPRIVYLDYTIFKSYASPEIFNIISDYIIVVFREFCSKHGYLEVAVNLDTFTISAFDRYKNLINIFCDKCFQQQNEFSKSLTVFSIYNLPNSFDTMKQVMAPFFLEEVKTKVRFYGKLESAPILRSFEA